ncbi:hypothetical protein JD969_16485 [Planctomycetota bacterium]|nr:hypothetical protein JD969_16485 [Planctomycetota bacterium]
MTHSTQFEKNYPIDVFIFASPVYWPDETKRKELFKKVCNELNLQTEYCNINYFDSCDSLNIATNNSDIPCIVIALSGGVQPWMLRMTEHRKHIAIYNAYLPDSLLSNLSGDLLHANAHPSSTDFFAYNKIRNKDIQWLSNTEELIDYGVAWNAASRLKNAKIIKIGETEPWVINSCRSPEAISCNIGTKIETIERRVLYDYYHNITNEDAKDEADRWLATKPELANVDSNDITKACRVTVAMHKLLAEHQADGLSMACFSMIGDIDTTSCLALSALNDSAKSIGACEGDLDAAVTLFLLKAMNADFVWIANPIIHPNNAIDFAHCTAPTCMGLKKLNYKLLRHHESGKGVAPEVVLPDALTATVARISMNTKQLVAHTGITQKQSKLPACHTQIRFLVKSTQDVLDHLLGTHFVLSYGDFYDQINRVASFIDFQFHGSKHNSNEQLTSQFSNLSDRLFSANRWHS